MNYSTIKEADDYFYNRPSSQKWFEFDELTKDRALTLATIKINSQKYIGSKTDPEQLNEFPRGTSTSIPAAIKYACIEEAFAILTDTNEERRNLIAAGVTSFSIGDLSENYKNVVDNVFISNFCRTLLNNFKSGGYDAL